MFKFLNSAEYFCKKLHYFKIAAYYLVIWLIKTDNHPLPYNNKFFIEFTFYHKKKPRGDKSGDNRGYLMLPLFSQLSGVENNHHIVDYFQ